MLTLIFFSSAFGILTKLADLFNEHAMKEPFRGAALLSGISWGMVGAGLIFFNPSVRLFYTALILYWVLRIKLDYKNHAIGGIIMLLASFMLCSPCDFNYLIEISLVIVAYEITRILEDKVKNPVLHKILSFRLYFIPFLYSVFELDFSVFLASLLAILGIKITNRLLIKSYDSGSSI